MIYINEVISENIARYDISEEVFQDIINTTIADITDSLNATFIKDRKVLLLKVLSDDKLVTISHNLTTKQLASISKQIIKSIEKYTISNEFNKFFKRGRFYKAVPINFKDGAIELKVINNNKASLYFFKLPTKSINFASIKNIKEKIFFKKNNILYISIKDFNKKTNVASCTQFSKNIFISLFLEMLDFLKKKQDQNYELIKITVKFDEKYKSVEYFTLFKNDKIINSNFLSILSHFLERKIGKIKINVKYGK